MSKSNQIDVSHYARPYDWHIQAVPPRWDGRAPFLLVSPSTGKVIDLPQPDAGEVAARCTLQHKGRGWRFEAVPAVEDGR